MSKAATAVVLGAALVGLSSCQRGVPASQSDEPPDATPFCEAAAQFTSRVAAVASTGPDGRIDDVESLWRELTLFLNEAARLAPPDVRADAEAASATVTEYYAALERAQFRGAAVPAPTAAKLQTPEFLAATTRLADFSRRTCGMAN